MDPPIPGGHLHRILLPLLLLGAASLSHSKVLDTAWTRTYGTGIGMMIVPMDTTGYLLSDKKAVYRLDAQGGVLWKVDFPASAILPFGAGAALVGPAEFVLLDSSGKEISRKPNGGSLMVPGPEGGLIVIEGRSNFLILTRIDRSGTVLPSKSYEETCSDLLESPIVAYDSARAHPLSLARASGGGWDLLYTAYCWKTGSVTRKSTPVLLRLDQGLDSMEKKELVGFAQYFPLLKATLLELSAGRWLLFGHEYVMESGIPTQAFYSIIDTAWGRKSRGVLAPTCRIHCHDSYAGNIVLTTKGAIIGTGQAEQSLWVGEFSTQADTLWTHTYPSPPQPPGTVPTSGSWITETPDSGFIATGGYGEETWVMKLNYYDSLQTGVISPRVVRHPGHRIGFHSAYGGKTEIRISGAGVPARELQLVDIHGRLALRFSPNPIQNQAALKWSFSTPDPGLYFLRVVMDRETFTVKWLAPGR